MTERKAFLDTWKFFAIAALPGFLSNFWVILRSPNFLNTQDFIEWAVLTSSVVLLCCLSQLGIKPGYMQEVTDKGVDNRYSALTSSVCVLSVTGLLAGISLVCLFKVLNYFQLWKILTYFLVCQYFALQRTFTLFSKQTCEYDKKHGNWLNYLSFKQCFR